MSRWRRGASPDGLRAKPLLIGGVRDSEQVQEKALSFRLSAAPTSLFGFVLLCQLLPFDMHINTCFIHGLLEENQSRSPCLLSVGTRSVRLVYVWTGLPFQSKFCDAASLSCNPKKWMIYVTVTPRVQNNRDCTSHAILSVFRQLVGFLARQRC